MRTSGGRSESERSGITRRDFLKTGLAGALLASSCTARRTVPGSLVGGSHRHAHRLRGGAFPPPSRVIETGIVILGGGIAGLSAAWKLRRSGLEEILLFELEDEAGGNSRSGRNHVTTYPWGAHYVPVPDTGARAVLELFRELGVITGSDAAGRPLFDERVLCHTPQERLFIHGTWQEGLFPSLGASAGDLAQLRAFRDAMEEFRRFRDRLGSRGFAIPVAESSQDERLLALDRMTMGEFLRREGFTSPRLSWYVEYGLRDDYGCVLETASAWAGVHYHACREEEHEVLTWPEGNGWIVSRLAAPLEGRLVGNALVTEVKQEDGRAVASILDTRTGEVTRVRARRAVLALPRFVARHVLDEERARPPAWLRDFTYAPWMVANLTVDRVPEGHGAPPSWDNVIYGSPSLGYVTATHQLLRQQDGPSVLTYYRPFTGDPSAERRAMSARSHEDWVEEVLGDLERALPGFRSTVSRCDVLLLGHAMVRPLPGFASGSARRDAARPRGPIHFAHSDLSGLSLFEEAQYQGVRAAEEVLAALGIPFESSLRA